MTQFSRKKSLKISFFACIFKILLLNLTFSRHRKMIAKFILMESWWWSSKDGEKHLAVRKKIHLFSWCQRITYFASDECQLLVTFSWKVVVTKTFQRNSFTHVCHIQYLKMEELSVNVLSKESKSMSIEDGNRLFDVDKFFDEGFPFKFFHKIWIYFPFSDCVMLWNHQFGSRVC